MAHVHEAPSDDGGGGHCDLGLTGLGAAPGPVCGGGAKGYDWTGAGWYMVGLTCGGGGVGLKLGGLAGATGMTGLSGANGLVETAGGLLATTGRTGGGPLVAGCA